MQNKILKKIIAVLIILLILAAAWFYGDGGSGGNFSNKGKTGKGSQEAFSDVIPGDKDRSPGSEGENPGSEAGDENRTQTTEVPGGRDSETTKAPESTEASENTNGAAATTDAPGGITDVPAVAEKPGENISPAAGPTEDPAATKASAIPGTDTITAAPALTSSVSPAQASTGGSGPTSVAGPASASVVATASPTPVPTLTSAPSFTPTPVPENVCTISIECSTILSHMDELNPKLKDYIPSDGVILDRVTVEFTEGESVFDVLKRVCDEHGIALEYSYVPAFKTVYIEGLAHIYEFDAGDLSGWQYFVNDEYVPVGCSARKVENGDDISWCYTCDLGKDL